MGYLLLDVFKVEWWMSSHAESRPLTAEA